VTAPPPPSDNLGYFAGVLGLDPAAVPANGEVMAKCPFHPDENPSLSVNVRTGLWKCHAGSCGRSGNRAEFERGLAGTGAPPPVVVTPEILQSYHEILLRAEKIMTYLTEKRGLSLPTIEKFNLGFDGDRIWIPIFKDGKPVNVRRCRKPGGTGEKILNMAGSGAIKIYPEESLASPVIYLCEGEWDALVAVDRGLPALTLTGGAGSFPNDLAEAFRGKDVAILYDCDEAGRRGAQKAAGRLTGVAAKIRIVNLGLAENGDDVTDWFVKYKRSAEDLKSLIEATPEFKASGEVKTRNIKADVLGVHLAETGEGQYAYRRLKLKFHIAGKDLAPYLVPQVVNWTCEMGQKLCAFCPLARANGAMTRQIDEQTPDEVLEFLDAPRADLEKGIRRACGIPEKCPKPHLEIGQWQNVEVLRAIPDLDFSYEGRSYTIRNLFFMGHGVEPNRTYDVEGVALPSPHSQSATMLIYHVKESEDSLGRFQVTPEFIEEQKIFSEGLV